MKKYKSGFEFQINGKEAMIWSARQGSKGWCYIVTLDWQVFTVMSETEIDTALNL